MKKQIDTEYEVQFSECSTKIPLQSRIHSLEVNSELNQPSHLALQLALSMEEMRDLTLDRLPKKIKFLWAKRLYFNGEATRIQVLGRNRVEILFEDALHRFSHMFTETQTKQQKLKAFLEKLVSSLENPPTVKFFSSDLFEEDLPTFALSARSIQQILQELSEFYGFTYFIRPDQSQSSPQLCFMRTGKGVNNQPIPTPFESSFKTPLTSHHVNWKYDTITVELMDGIGDPKKKPLRGDSFKKPLEGYKAGDEMKRGFDIHLPELELPVSHPDLYARAERILSYQYNLKSQGVDSKVFTQAKATLQIGDCIETQEANSQYQDQARYLVQATRILVQSAQPRMEIKAVRP